MCESNNVKWLRSPLSKLLGDLRHVYYSMQKNDRFHYQIPQNLRLVRNLTPKCARIFHYIVHIIVSSMSSEAYDSQPDEVYMKFILI